MNHLHHNRSKRVNYVLSVTESVPQVSLLGPKIKLPFPRALQSVVESLDVPECNAAELQMGEASQRGVR